MIEIQDFKPILLDRKDILFRVANHDDLNQIQSEIFPYLDEGHSDKQSLSEFNSDANKNIIGIKDDRIVHYFLIYDNALDSPLIQNTPFNRSILKKSDAYLGSTFTISCERGNWIVPSSLSFIIESYRTQLNKKRVFVLVHETTPGATEFYQRLGFNIVENAAPKGPIQWLIAKLNS
jgi:hypothetical protein